MSYANPFASALLAGCALAGFAFAAPSLEQRKDELDEVRERARQLRQQISRDEGSRDEAAEQLREVDSAISGATRRLRELTDERSAAEREQRDFAAQRERLEQQTAQQQHQLGRLLNRRFVGGEADALKLLLSGDDPNQAARDRYLMTRLSQAQAGMIRKLQSVATEKQRLAGEAGRRAERIAVIAGEQQREQEALQREHKKRQELLTKIGRRLDAQKKTLSSLQRDEKRLAELLDGLAKAAVERKRRAEQREAAEKAEPPATRKEPKVGAGRTARNAAAAAEPPPERTSNFSKLRGSLPQPLAGELAGRFGAPRRDGEAASTWKGWFVRAEAGREARAVAAGQVVYADWMRGYGNLVIVDHGDDYLSIYAYAQALLKQAGERVAGGQALATAGASGSAGEAGLYFELRHRGQPLDPAKWLKR